MSTVALLPDALGSLPDTRCDGADVLDAARSGDVASALDGVTRELSPGTLFAGHSTRWALATPRTARTSSHVFVDGRVIVREECQVTLHTSAVLERVGLVAARVDLRRPATDGGTPGPGANLARQVVHLRLGLATWLVDQCQAYLSTRRSAGVPMLQHQLVRGALADAVLDLLQAHAGLDTATAQSRQRAATVRASHLITCANRVLLRLLGASGYLLTGSGATAHVSELMENVYVTPRAPTSAIVSPRKPEPPEPQP